MANLRIEYVKGPDGASIACAAVGQGPDVVLSPNAFGGIHLYSHGATPWIDQVAATGWRIVLYDSSGSGASDRDVADFSQERRVSDLECAIDKMVESDRFVLVAGTHGGLTAIEYAVRHSERLTQLVLWDAYARGADFYNASPYTRAIEALSPLALEDWEFFTMNLGHWATKFEDPAGARAAARALRLGMSAEAYLKWVEETKLVDVSALLPQISVPTLVIQDRTSVLSVPEHSRSLASAIPKAQFTTVRGPEAGAEAMIDFIASKAVFYSEGAGQAGGSFRTVLFTDLVGHTEMMSRLGDHQGRAVLRDHETVTRAVLKQPGGAEVKTMGDGFMASFGSVTKAVECAIALQRAFAERDGEPLCVRVGLNAGEPIEEDGDLFGAMVILASRIAAKADAGEILVADTVRGCVAAKGSYSRTVVSSLRRASRSRCGCMR